MESLKRQALSFGEYPIRLPTGRRIGISTWTIRFPKWSGAKLPRSLAGTYKNKTLVKFYGRPLFGELAVLRWLKKDGWDGVWVDTFHSRGQKKLFWKGLPDRSSPCVLPAKAEAMYKKIVAVHPKDGGFFDVFAWKGRKFLFVEYKSKGDKLNQNQYLWIRSALKSGVPSNSLLLVEFVKRA
jgi:hypothetical protein